MVFACGKDNDTTDESDKQAYNAIMAKQQVKILHKFVYKCSSINKKAQIRRSGTYKDPPPAC